MGQTLTFSKSRRAVAERDTRSNDVPMGSAVQCHHQAPHGTRNQIGARRRRSRGHEGTGGPGHQRQASPWARGCGDARVADRVDVLTGSEGACALSRTIARAASSRRQVRISLPYLLTDKFTSITHKSAVRLQRLQQCQSNHCNHCIFNAI